MVDVFQGAASLLFDEPAPEVHDVLRALGQVAARCQMTHQIARSDGQGRILRAGDLGIALAVGLMPDLGVDIAGGARHVTRAHRLAAGGFHRIVDVAGQLAGGRVAGGNAVVVILPVQREGIGGAARQQHLIPRHPAADLRQPHAFLVHSRRINGIGDRHLRVIRHGAGGLGKRLLERISGVVGGFGHLGSPPTVDNFIKGSITIELTFSSICLVSIFVKMAEVFDMPDLSSHIIERR